MNLLTKIGLTIIIFQLIVMTYKYFKKKKYSNTKKQEKKKFKNFGIDEITMERLIKHELIRKPGISRNTAIKWALNRLIRDNR